MIDPLEPRYLMALTSIVGGVLRIFGDPHDNLILVNTGTVTTTIKIFGATEEYLTSAYSSILIKAGGGNDFIRLTGQFSRPGLIDGEGGNDTVLGSPMIETLVGGPGNDVIYYQTGDIINPQESGANEFLFGNPPPMPEPTLIDGVLRITGIFFSDLIHLGMIFSSIRVSQGDRFTSFPKSNVQSIIIDGRIGNDRIQIDPSITLPTRLYGGTGNDTIVGGSGVDRIYGGEGNDWITGNAGNDVIYGENGNDRLFGGAGRDYIVGGAGSDVLRGESGMDQILASTGLDDFRGNAEDLITLI